MAATNKEETKMLGLNRAKVTYYTESHNKKICYIKENDFGGHFANKVKVEITKSEYNWAKALGK
jgi:hypothetical protein